MSVPFRNSTEIRPEPLEDKELTFETPCIDVITPSILDVTSASTNSGEAFGKEYETVIIRPDCDGVYCIFRCVRLAMPATDNASMISTTEKGGILLWFTLLSIIERIV